MCIHKQKRNIVSQLFSIADKMRSQNVKYTILVSFSLRWRTNKVYNIPV